MRECFYGCTYFNWDFVGWNFLFLKFITLYENCFVWCSQGSHVTMNKFFFVIKGGNFNFVKFWIDLNLIPWKINLWFQNTHQIDFKMIFAWNLGFEEPLKSGLTNLLHITCTVHTQNSNLIYFFYQFLQNFLNVSKIKQENYPSIGQMGMFCCFSC